MKSLISAIALLAIAGAAQAQPPAGGQGYGQGGGPRGGGQMSPVRRACTPDVMQFCTDVQRGGGRIVQCLREHQDQVSPACKIALADTPAGPRRRPGPPSDSPPPPPNPPS